MRQPANSVGCRAEGGQAPGVGRLGRTGRVAGQAALFAARGLAPIVARRGRTGRVPRQAAPIAACGLASTVARPGRSGQWPQQSTQLGLRGQTSVAAQLSQSGPSPRPASRLASHRIMLLHSVSTRRPAQLSPHRPQKRLCGDAPSPDAVVVPSPWPPGRHHVSLCRRLAACHQRRGRRFARIWRSPHNASIRHASRSSRASVPALVTFSPEALRTIPQSDDARGAEPSGTASAGQGGSERRADPPLGGACANAQYRLDDVQLSETLAMLGQVLELRFASISLITVAPPAQRGRRTAEPMTIQAGQDRPRRFGAGPVSLR